MTELCSTCSVFEVCSCVRTCVRRVRVDSLVKGTCVRAFEGTRSRNTEILCSSVFRVREQLRNGGIGEEVYYKGFSGHGKLEDDVFGKLEDGLIPKSQSR